MNFDLNPGSSAVQTHITVVQGIIVRMAENSRSCKLWCITIVSAILVLVARVGIVGVEYTLIALLPIVLLCYLDARYLELERAFRNSYNDFVRRLHNCELSVSDIYVLEPMGGSFREALTSWSVLLFYAVMVVCVLAVYLLGLLGT